MRYRRMRAARVILRAYRCYKVKSYVREVNRRFRNVGSMKDYGRQVKWPTPPKVLRKFEEALRSIYSRYSVERLVRFYFNVWNWPPLKSHFQRSSVLRVHALAGGVAHGAISYACHVRFRLLWYRAEY